MPVSMGAFHIIGRIPYFRELPAEEIEVLAQRARLWHGAEDAVLFAEGDTAAGLYYVVNGSVKVVRHSAEGRRLIVREFQPGETLNEVGALDGNENVATAIAGHRDTLALLIPGELVRELAARYPALSNEMMQEMARKLRFAMTRVGRLGLMDVKARLCAWLLDNMDEQNTLRGLPQEHVAEQLGTVRQVIGRALAELRDAGIVDVGRGFIKVIDKERLRELID